jgi:hypothetical protein
MIRRLWSYIQRFEAWLACRDSTPDPEPLQIWQSMNSGRSYRVAEVKPADGGDFFWTIQPESRPGEFESLGQTYFGQRAWRNMVKNERRVLVTPATSPLNPPRPSSNQVPSFRQPEPSALTDWFTDLLPWEPGEYERDYAPWGPTLRRDVFDGMLWRYAGARRIGTECIFQSLPWRGLASNPKETNP